MRRRRSKAIRHREHPHPFQWMEGRSPPRCAASSTHCRAKENRCLASLGTSWTRKSSSIPDERLSGMIHTPKRGPVPAATCSPSKGIAAGSEEKCSRQRWRIRSHCLCASPLASTTAPSASRPEAASSPSMAPGFSISSTPSHDSIWTTGWPAASHTTPLASNRNGITRLSVSPSTSNFLGCTRRISESPSPARPRRRLRRR